MKKMKCIAIDDEKLALNKIKRYVEKIQYLDLIEVFDNAIDAVPFLKENEVHLIFLDIEMDELNGIEFLESIHNIPYIVITSAYKTYAIKSYEFNVIDYLLKPVEFSRFLKAVEKVFVFFKKDYELQATVPNKTESTDDYIFLQEGRKIVKIHPDEILYIEGMKDYLRVCTKNNKLMILSNFDSIINKLPKNNFIRIHKSYCVSLSKITGVEKSKVFINDKIIPVGISYKLEFHKQFYNFKNRENLI